MKTDSAVRYVAEGPRGNINSKYCRGHLVVTTLGECNSPSSHVVAPTGWLDGRKKVVNGTEQGGSVIYLLMFRN